MSEQTRNFPEEAQSFKSHRAEDLLETEGSNKGNIKEEGLAQVGAEAEDRLRNGTTHKLKRLGDAIIGFNAAEKDANDVGELAMKEEIRKRVAIKGKAKKLSPEAIKTEQAVAANLLQEKQLKLTNERVREEREEL